MDALRTPGQTREHADCLLPLLPPPGSSPEASVTLVSAERRVLGEPLASDSLRRCSIGAGAPKGLSSRRTMARAPAGKVGGVRYPQQQHRTPRRRASAARRSVPCHTPTACRKVSRTDPAMGMAGARASLPVSVGSRVPPRLHAARASGDV